METRPNWNVHDAGRETLRVGVAGLLCTAGYIDELEVLETDVSKCPTEKLSKSLNI